MDYKRKKRYFTLTDNDIISIAEEYGNKEAVDVCSRGYGIVSRAEPDGKTNHDIGWVKTQFIFITEMVKNRVWDDDMKVIDIKKKDGEIYSSLLKAIYLTNKNYGTI